MIVLNMLKLFCYLELNCLYRHKSISSKGPKKVQRTTQTRNVHFDRRRPQTLELRRYYFPLESFMHHHSMLQNLHNVTCFRLSSLLSGQSDNSEDKHNQNGRSYMTRNRRYNFNYDRR